jgi:hypothetical protein
VRERTSQPPLSITATGLQAGWGSTINDCPPPLLAELCERVRHLLPQLQKTFVHLPQLQRIFTARSILSLFLSQVCGKENTYSTVSDRKKRCEAKNSSTFSKCLDGFKWLLKLSIAVYRSSIHLLWVYEEKKLEQLSISGHYWFFYKIKKMFFFLTKYLLFLFFFGQKVKSK